MSAAQSNSVPGPSLVPANDLTLTSTAPPPPGTNPPPSRFLLFTQEWLDLQNYIQLALSMPITQGDFNAKYGDFPATDKGLIDGAVGAMKDVSKLSDVFGSPVTIKSKIISDPQYLLTQTPPAEIYGNIVWLANQISNTASTFSYTLANLAPLIGPDAGTPAVRAANLRAILDGPGGLASSAALMQQQTSNLMTKLLTFDGNITAANTQILNYVGSGSSLLQKANTMIGTMTDDINNNLQPAADNAYKLWRDYTIAAVTTSVGIMILSFGLAWPVAVGLGVGLGVAAALEKKAYNDLMDQIATERGQIQQKTNLVTDLSGFNGKIGLVAPALGTFKSSLETVEGTFNTAALNLAFIANNFSDAQLADYSWVMQTLKIGDAQSKWQAISATTQQYTSNSLVTYNFSTNYGQKIA
ncbi:hypothetical protein [Terriglobus saanensis]|uniref:Uncharacterized protein n=1 Tax=Terriglobus saanensis (strain ATCC BAA-1853 / DSM 23119 / SP1PR4) TaxID=401053 RepID=E8UWY1_TERSS|nr:hypothetical protein [Terriglobus saanensis]ADV81868.1 hypothetical protein AciPR4_1037 [Terriglobus saanensis SP1PR4]